MSETALLNIPYIMAAQAQKHVTHNEALRILDALVHLAVEDRDRSDPPADPAEGQRHALGEAPTGVFAGQAGHIAAFQDGAWTFHMPQEGWLVWDKAETALFVFDDGGWTPVSADMDSLPYLGINATADETNRLALASESTLLSHDGAGHRIKVNKAAAGETGSLLFQTGWSGRAEMGLAGTDDFSLKVSADGSAWLTALTVARATGRLGFGVASPQAMLHVKIPADGDTLFRFDDAAGSSLWSGKQSGVYLNTDLGGSLLFNMVATNYVGFNGGRGLICETISIATAAADHAAGSKSLRIGDTGAGYATSSQPLTKPNMVFQSRAWNGTNGYSIGTTAWVGLEQTAASSGQAAFFWRMGSFGSSNRMQLDNNGNLSTAGSISATAHARVGSYTAAALPSASTAGAGAIIYVSNEAGGATLAFSDGTDWRRTADRAVVS